MEQPTFFKGATGLVINKIRYVFSQTWPFQNNLMLGFEAEAKESKISINREEIEDAKFQELPVAPQVVQLAHPVSNEATPVVHGPSGDLAIFLQFSSIFCSTVSFCVR